MHPLVAAVVFGLSVALSLSVGASRAAAQVTTPQQDPLRRAWELKTEGTTPVVTTRSSVRAPRTSSRRLGGPPTR